MSAVLVPLTIVPGRFTPDDHREPPLCRDCAEVLVFVEGVGPGVVAVRHLAKRGGRTTICVGCTATRTREKRHARRAAGLCQEFGCQSSADPGRSRCPEHSEVVRAHSALYKAEHLAERRTSDRAANRARRARYVARTADELADDRERLRPDGLKRCRRCGEHLALSEFSAHAKTPDGLQDDCRACTAARAVVRRTRPFLSSWQEADLWRCSYCAAPYEDVEHVIPSSHPLGTDDPHNVVPACAACNRGPGGKFDRPLLDWLPEDLLSRLAHLPAISLDGTPLGTFGDALAA